MYAVAAATLFAAVARADVQIDCAFPGGNILVERIEDDTIALKQDRRDTEGWWFYWCFRVNNAAGRRLHFKFTDGAPIGVRGPAVSNDEGSTWRWLGTETSTTNTFSYSFPDDARSVRFSFGMPYTEKSLAAFLRRFAGNPAIQTETLCVSRKGRPVEFLRLGRLDGSATRRVFITCRHHCCEMMASYVAEGLMASVLAEDDLGLWYRDNVEVAVVPFVDKDGVEDGDQGKNRRPRDHNRDYDDAGIYPETRAIRSKMPAWSGGRPLVAIDLHCPWIRAGENEHIYQVGRENADSWAQQQKFGKMLEEVHRGPLPYRAADDLPFGQKWNTAKNYTAGVSFGRWSEGVPGVCLATTFEIPYANASGAEVNADSARAFGKDLALALRRYLEAIPPR